MSHATVLVITKPGQTIEELLAPYSEDLEVPPHPRKCYCVDSEGKPDPQCSSCKSTGTVETTTNPNAKWDWYQLGGRWTGMLAAKDDAVALVGRPGLMTPEAPSGMCDQVRFGDVDWERVRQQQRRAAAEQWDYFHEHPQHAFGDKTVLELSRDEYIEQNQELSTFAVLMPDGVWHERAQLGWFGAESNAQEPQKWRTEFTELLSSCEDDWTLSIVDYHI